MGRILSIVLLLLVGMLVWRSLAKKLAARDADDERDRARPGPVDGAATPPASAAKVPALMSQCAHCGMHLPTDEAIQADGHPFCSAEHARLGMPTKPR